MELPIEKQIRIMDALFRDELSIRDTSELFDIAKSTA